MGERLFEPNYQLSRRRLLQGVGAVVGARVLGGCTKEPGLVVESRPPETTVSTPEMSPTTTTTTPLPEIPTTTEQATTSSTTSTTSPETSSPPTTEAVQSTPEIPGTMLGGMSIPTSEGLIETPYFQAEDPYSSENVGRSFDETLLTYIDNGPGLYGGYPGRGFAKPGELGNKVIFGHRTTHTAPFRHIDDIQPGTEMAVDYLGNQLRYVALESWLATHPEDGSHPLTAKVLEHLPDQDVITIFACHPEGSARERFVWRFVRQEQ